jgi:hypothetical protein
MSETIRRPPRRAAKKPKRRRSGLYPGPRPRPEIHPKPVKSQWRCRCRFPDGTVEVTDWVTEDGADQMASEMETHHRARCTVRASF